MGMDEVGMIRPDNRCIRKPELASSQPENADAVPFAAIPNQHIFRGRRARFGWDFGWKIGDA